MDIRPPEPSASALAHGERRNGTLLRMTAWGSCAALAAAVLVFVAQTPAGGERIDQALSGTAEPVAAPAENDQTVRALEARIAALTGDRDRLAKRVAALESGVSDLTGSVRRQAAATPSSAPQAPPAIAAPAQVSPLIVAVAPPLINPLATPPAGVASILPDPAPPQAVAAAPAAQAEPDPPAKSPDKTPDKTPTDDMVPESAAPQDAADTAPTGSIPTTPEPKPAAPAHGRAEFGIELATEPNMDGLRKRWAGVKANYGPLLVGLSPVAVRDPHPGSSNVRLVAGPLPSIAAARKLCARFAAMNGDCWPARINPAEVVQR